MFSSQMIERIRTVTKTGPELLSAWISGCAHVEKSPLPGEYPVPLPLSSLASPGQTFHLSLLSLHPSALSFSLSLTYTPPHTHGFPSCTLCLPEPPPTSTHYFDFFFKCHHQQYCLYFTGWFTTHLFLWHFVWHSYDCSYTPGSDWGPARRLSLLFRLQSVSLVQECVR